MWSWPIISGFALLGCFAGFLSGLLGIGGGVILVPLFLWSFHLSGVSPDVLVHSAFATSLAIIIPTAVSNTLGHYRHGMVNRRHVILLASGAVFGAVMGAWGASQFHGETLKVAFGAMQIGVALKLLHGALKSPPQGSCRDTVAMLSATGLTGGFYSAFFGVGGGVVAVPLMVLLLKFPIHLAVGNSTALIVISSLTGTLSYIVSGWGNPALPSGCLGFVNLPVALVVVPFSLLGARWGVALARRFSHAKLVKSFAILLICVGVRIIWSTF
ncbi:MAG: sulfite exporter TauE/SafE family protein [Desulfuromonadaceae bacterium]|nr:sulfite exporter TauE/SafE family protein [Desulfuromonadaceae bacterium]